MNGWMIDGKLGGWVEFTFLDRILLHKVSQHLFCTFNCKDSKFHYVESLDCQ